MMGFGASTMLFGNIASLLIASPAFGWQRVFFVFALCIGTMLCITALVLRLPPGDNASDSYTTKLLSEPNVDYPPRLVLRRKSFWLLFIAMSLLGSIGSSVFSFSRDISLSVGIKAQIAALLVGVLSIANGFGRILAGILYDLLHRKFILAYVGILAAIACLICILAIVKQSAVLCALGLILVGLSYGSNTFALSAVLNAYYGTRYFPQNLSLGLLVMLPSSFLAKFATTLVTATSSYLVPFVVMCAFSITALILNLNNNRP
jgi:OFA family oxalate/formate antiporter-like MFS transporter